ncbi:hypothetical protein P9600_gp30 [Escherichia phage vB_EcoD_Opt212]|uniref:Uncharacterized protein n=17 Tax=Dhillonvirus TaxID=1623289 RepID=A0AAE8Z286_9CAUD|nr:hypothetical protein P9600_gp30 [Escherichia phage vB_EcoD_Opt212]UHS64811.1 hypothetical protein OPT212_30 [Escherichia phage vB_EcoD_Opt212]
MNMSEWPAAVLTFALSTTYPTAIYWLLNWSHSGIVCRLSISRILEMIEEKRCSNCGCVKPLSQFHKYTGKTARSPDGYRAECKSCRNKKERERQRRYRAEQK